MTTAPERPEPPLTVGGYLEDWLRLHQTQVQPSTWLSYAKTIRGYLKSALGATARADLEAAQLNRLYVALLPPAAATAARCRCAPSVTATPSCARRSRTPRRVGLVAVNVGDLATLPRIDPRASDQGRRPLQSWTAGQLRTFLDHAAGHPLAPLWVVAAGTACAAASYSGCPGATSTSTGDGSMFARPSRWCAGT